MTQKAQNTGDDILLIDDDLWDELVKLTDGAASLCYSCGTCTAICPWGIVKNEHLSVRSFMRLAQTGIQDQNKDLWLCTTCAQCHEYCPRGVDIVNVFRGLRSIAWKNRSVAENLPSLLWSEFWNDNPWSQPPSHRAHWAEELDIPLFDADVHEILFYVGCTSSYDLRAQKIAISLVQLLRAAGVKFGFLGNDELCCGEAVLSVGHKPYFAEISENTSRLFLERNVTRLMNVSPHCYDVFRNHYPMLKDRVEPLHYTQYLARLLEEGRLKFEHPVDVRVTFQDPCYLGRHNQEYDAPRKILESIPGVELVEMANSKQNGLCCGGGGGRMWLETPVGERFSDLRVQEVVRTEVDTLCTACPFCIVCLEDSVKVLKVNNLDVLDIAEIAALSLASGQA
ncbi:MAG: (Fe-S)-binding protein [Anaerolineaceae bacterium]|nr:(Fe-S)-binding protein [Anaerolineaceae bacterium]